MTADVDHTGEYVEPAANTKVESLPPPMTIISEVPPPPGDEDLILPSKDDKVESAAPVPVDSQPEATPSPLSPVEDNDKKIVENGGHATLTPENEHADKGEEKPEPAAES